MHAGLTLGAQDRPPVEWYRPTLAMADRAAFGYRTERRQLTYETADAVGQMLTDENLRSVRFRYEHGADNMLLRQSVWPAPYVFPPLCRTRFWHTPDPLVILRAISCYEYQSCEHADWPTSEAKRFCDVLRLFCISELPGYKSAMGWPINEWPPKAANASRALGAAE